MRFKFQLARNGFDMTTVEIIAPVIFFCSVSIGTVFYMFNNDWSFDISYYYAMQVLLGNMYGVPTEPNDESMVFTLFYFIWGTTMLAAFIGALANNIMISTVKAVSEERAKALEYVASQRSNVSRIAGFTSSAEFQDLPDYGLRTTEFLVYIGYFEHKTRYLCLFLVFLWYLVGVAYGLYFENWDVSHSSFCALSAMAANGLCPPDCSDGDIFSCKIGVTRALLHGHYILVGVPLFAFTMAQMVGLLIERAVRASEQKLLQRPLTETEFKLAAKFRSSHGPAEMSKKTAIDLGGFIVMELLRLRKIDECDLEFIEALFNKLDLDKNGVIDLAELQTEDFLSDSATKPTTTTTVTSTHVHKSTISQESLANYNAALQGFLSGLRSPTRAVARARADSMPDTSAHDRGRLTKPRSFDDSSIHSTRSNQQLGNSPYLKETTPLLSVYKKC